MSNIFKFIGNERGDSICEEADGCPTEMAVLKRYWRETQATKNEVNSTEEVDNLTEMLVSASVPYEDSQGMQLSLVGRVKWYLNFNTNKLREQVEKLTEECVVLRASNKTKLDTISYLETREDENQQKLAALAEQNERQKEALLYVMRATVLAYDDKPNSPIGWVYKVASDAYELPNHATPVMNRIRAEGMREAEKIVRKRVQWVSNGQGIQYRSTAPESISAESLADEIRARAAELEKTNG